jgi:ribosomal protein S18 acetylase RimI-like enzyme
MHHRGSEIRFTIRRHLASVDRVEYELRRWGGGDWQDLRRIRLEMLADTPLAYVETLASARQLTDAEWQNRAAWGDAPDHCGVAGVEAATGAWIALARGAVPDDDADARASLFSVYAAPATRGRGIADVVVGAVEDWARGAGHPALYLHVLEPNARAIAFYRRRGYVFTGATLPYELDPRLTELEMRRYL